MFCSRCLFVFAILTVTLTPFLIKTNNKNTCDSYFAYFLINFSDSCFHNPDVELGVPALIEKYAGTVQVYNVTTEDGYILTTFRIARNDPVGVILLQPPISGGSMSWLSDGRQSLAFALWRKGYDVWLSTHRGIPYSRKHVNLTVSDPQFWDFSFHEIAIYDLDPQFHLIRNVTNNSQIIYIGYSLSSTEALIYASLKPENAEKFVKSFILVTPLSTIKHVTGPFKYLLLIMKSLEKFVRIGEFTMLEIIRWLAPPLNMAPYVLNIMMSTIMGWTSGGMDPALYPYLMAHHARGISNKMIQHYGQSYFNDGNFAMYDYGEESNKKLYGSSKPPQYPLRDIRNPMYIVYGEKDVINSPIDVEHLCDNLLPQKKIYGKYPIPDQNHVDFIFNKHRSKIFYQTIFNILDEVEKIN